MRNKRSTYYLLIYHDSITVFLLPYILSDLLDEVVGPTQVKCRHLISSIFDAMNFQHSSEMLEFDL